MPWPKGRSVPPDLVERRAAAMRGRVNPNNSHPGRQPSPETLAKLREANYRKRGKKHPDGCKHCISVRRDNMTPEARKALGDSLRGRKLPISEEERERRRLRQRGKPGTRLGMQNSEEHNRKIGAARRGVKFTDEWRKRLSESHKGLPSSWKGRKHSAHTRALISAKSRRNWNDPSYVERVMRSRQARRHSRPNTIEAILRRYIAEQYPGELIGFEHRVGRYLIDVAIPSLMLAFEADGEYWHSLLEVQERDRRKDTALSALGWTVKRFEERWLRSLYA